MIFNCPSCDKKYLLSASALGAEGRKVRCVSCGHIWFQQPERDVSSYNQPEEPEEIEDIEEEDVLDEPEKVEDEWEDDDEVSSAPFDEVQKEIEEELEAALEEEEQDNDEEDEEELDIPKGVQPLQDELEDSESQIKPPPVEEALADKMMGYSAALVIFFIVIVGAFIAKNSIVSAWPASAAIYNLAGFSTAVSGDGLVIDSLTARQEGADGKIILQGSVLNTTNKPVNVPQMRAIFRLDDAGTDNVWTIDPPTQSLSAGDSFSFTSSYDNPPDDVSIINLSFVSDF